MKKIDKYGNYGYQGIHRVRVAKTTTVYEIYDGGLRKVNE